MKTINIDKGINFHFINTDKFKTTVVCILLRQKLSRESATVTALIPQILSNGSEKYGAISEINAVLEKMYGCIFQLQAVKKGEEQLIQFYLEFVNGKTEDFSEIKSSALEFVKELMLKPLIVDSGFRKDFVDGEKQNLRNAIGSRINNKAEYAKLRCLEEMFKDEPFGVYGDGYLEDLTDDNLSLTPQAIYEKYLQILRKAPIEFVVIGNEDESFFIDKIKELFVVELVNLGRTTDDNELIIQRADIHKNLSDEKNCEESQNISQGKLCIGVRTGADPNSDRFYELLMFNELLGGSPNSRLFFNVREKESLCYYINSYVYRFKSTIIIQSGVDGENFDMVLQMIKTEVESIASGDIADDEFESARKSLIMKFSAILDSQSSMIDFNMTQYMLGENSDLRVFLTKIANVKKESLSMAAKSVKFDTIFMLKPDREAVKVE